MFYGVGPLKLSNAIPFGQIYAELQRLLYYIGTIIKYMKREWPSLPAEKKKKSNFQKRTFSPSHP